jgi:hypothetical protein
MKELTDFLDKYNVQYIVDNGNVIADEIDLSYCEIIELPKNFHLIKCDVINLYKNRISKLPENFHLLKCSNINLSHNKIIKLPENFHLLKCDTIRLSNNIINKLPENFSLIKCSYLDLSHNKINKLPENFHLLKCKYLYLYYNNISKLPENFHLLKCRIINLSNNLNWLSSNHQFFDDIEITKEYIYCDDLLMWYDNKKQVNDYTVYVGRFGDVVVTKDNETFAHGDTIRQAISDLSFKLSDRNKDEYLDIDKGEQHSIEEMIIMYRTITGACSYGVENFMTGKHFNETISINEINDIIGNEYGSKSFREFFKF